MRIPLFNSIEVCADHVKFFKLKRDFCPELVQLHLRDIRAMDRFEAPPVITEISPRLVAQPVQEGIVGITQRQRGMILCLPVLHIHRRVFRDSLNRVQCVPVGWKHQPQSMSSRAG